MTTYSYSTFQAPQDEQQPAPRGTSVNHEAGTTTSVVVREGVAYAETSRAGHVSSGELNPHYGDGTVFATARSQHGFGVQAITPDTLITIAGVQAPVKAFEAQGLIHKTAEGRYAEGLGKPHETSQEAPQADLVDFHGMTQESADSIDAALNGVADHQLEPLIARGIANVTGDLGEEALVRHLVDCSGVAPEEATQRVATIKAAYQAQADATITHTCGLQESDLADFWDYCKVHQKGALRDAVAKQVRENSVAGYRDLADKFYRVTPPSLNAVKAAGLQVRESGDLPEVFLGERWLTIAAAARLGMI